MPDAFRFLIVFVLMLGVFSPSQAQYKSRLGRFQVDQIKGCAPFTVNITDADLPQTGECTSNKPCLMSAGDGTPQSQNKFSITYANPGTYKLSILYGSIGADDITITVDQNIKPPFEIYACANNQAVVKVTDNHYDQYVIDFQNDGTPEKIIPFSNNAIAQFNYGSAGTFNIAVRGRDLNAADQCDAEVLPFTTLATLPTPTITTLTAIDPTSLKLDFTVQNNIQYKLEIAVNGASSFQVFQNLYNTSSVTIPNLLQDENFYCFRLSAYNPCTNQNNYSNTICSKDLDLVVSNGVNALSWKTNNNNITSTQIVRNQSPYTTIPGAVNVFNDLDADCNVNYCYSVVSVYGNGSKSSSLAKCGTAFDNTPPPSIENVTAVVAGDAQLNWKTDPTIKPKEFDIWRSSSGRAFSIIKTTGASPFSDPGYTTEDAFCYQINYRDLCDNNSLEGIITCPIRLGGSIDGKNVISLSWTKYKGWKSGVASYQVEKLDASKKLIKTFNVGTDTLLIDDQPDLTHQVVTYQVKATAVENGLGITNSNSITFTKEVNLTFPTAFTPNLDKLNDQFTITGQFVAKMNIKVFDRWGTLIFASEKNEPWDGTRSGVAMPESTYIWKAEITDLAGRTFTREGTLVLLRK